MSCYQSGEIKIPSGNQIPNRRVHRQTLCYCATKANGLKAKKTNCFYKNFIPQNLRRVFTYGVIHTKSQQLIIMNTRLPSFSVTSINSGIFFYREKEHITKVYTVCTLHNVTRFNDKIHKLKFPYIVLFRLFFIQCYTQ